MSIKIILFLLLLYKLSCGLASLRRKKKMDRIKQIKAVSQNILIHQIVGYMTNLHGT